MVWKDRAIGSHNHTSSSAFHTDWIIHGFVSVYLSKISIRKTISFQEFPWRFHDQSLIRSSFQIVTNSLLGVFMHKLWAEHLSCSMIDSISNVRLFVSGKIHKHSNPANVIKIARGRLFTCKFGKRLSFSRGFQFAVPTSRPRVSNTCLIRPFCVILWNLFLELCSMWVWINLAASSPCSKWTCSACNWMVNSTISFSFLV